MTSLLCVAIPLTTSLMCGRCALLGCFLAARSGQYTAHAWVGCHPVRTRLQCHVHPAALAVGACVLRGEGARRAVSGVRSGFTICACDAFGNLLGRGGLSWRVAIESPLAVVVSRSLRAEVVGAPMPDGPITVHDGGDGRYHVGYCLAHAGRYAVRIWLDDDNAGDNTSGDYGGDNAGGVASEMAGDDGPMPPLLQASLEVTPAALDPLFWLFSRLRASAFH